MKVENGSAATPIAQTYSTEDIERQINQVLEAEIAPDQKLNQVMELLAQYTSETLPSPRSLGLSQSTWLHIYWAKLGQERNQPVSAQEETLNVPLSSTRSTIVYDRLSDYVMTLRPVAMSTSDITTQAFWGLGINSGNGDWTEKNFD